MVKATYKHDKNYGDQYNPISIYALIPQTRESQLMFLQSIISPWLAENLINAYPNVVNDVANGTLKEIDYDLVKGVREFTWNKIKEKIIMGFNSVSSHAVKNIDTKFLQLFLFNSIHFIDF